MLDLSQETIISFNEAAGRIPSYRPGRKTHVATLHRWAKDGVRGVKLDSARLGGRLVTSDEALQRFSDALSQNPDASVPPVQSSAARTKAVERAERELDKIGI